MICPRLKLDVKFLKEILHVMLVWIKINPFVNLEDDISYFNAKEEVINFGDINAHTRIL